MSIKPSNKDATSTSGGFLPGGRFALVNSPIATLIRQAYPSDSTQLIGAPAWVTSERYDVTVVATGEPTREAFRELLRAVLAQRFKLASHYEEQPREAYALVLARADGRLGPELRKYPFDCVAYLEQQGPQNGATPPPPASHDLPAFRILQITIAAEPELIATTPHLAIWPSPSRSDRRTRLHRLELSRVNGLRHGKWRRMPVVV